jgi:oxygen-dependent protoporphyrinogen oxidase
MVSPPPIAILGAGLTGLVAAWRLAQAGHSVLLCDTAPRVGGVIRSERQGPWLVEIGPNSFTSAPQLDALINGLGMRDRAIATPLREHDRFVWKAGRLRRVPTGPGQLLTADCLTAGDKIRLLRGLLSRYEPPAADLPLAEFFRNLVGPGVVDSLLKPFLSGVYAADADRVSFESTFRKLFLAVQANRRLPSAIKALRAGSTKSSIPKALTSFREGLETLPLALAEGCRAAGVRIETGATPRIEPTAAGWLLHGAGDPFAAKTLALTGDALGTATILDQIGAPRAAAALRAIEYAPLTILHIGLREDACRDRRRGFGFLSVADQGVDALGMIWNDRIFPGRAPEGHRLLTCFYGGEKHPEANDWDDDRLRAAAARDCRTVLGVERFEPALFRITRWKRALPVFRVGHRARLDEGLADLPSGIRLAGSYLGGVSIPDRVAAAEALAAELQGAAAT